MLQSPSKQIPWNITQFSQSPSAALSYFLENRRWSENLFSFKGDFSFGKKPEVTGSQIWAVGGLSQLDDLMFHQKTLHKT